MNQSVKLELCFRNKTKYYKLYDGDNIIVLPSVTTVLKILDKGEGLTNWKINKTIEFIKMELLKESTKNNGKIDLSNSKIIEILESSGKEMDAFETNIKNIGIQIHKYIENFIKNKININDLDSLIEKEPEQQIKNGLNAFKQWMQTNNFIPLCSELNVYNLELKYAGQIDCIGLLNDQLYLIDFKTSSGIYDEQICQLAAYEYAYNLMNPSKQITGIGILRLDKTTGLPEWHDFSKVKTLYLEMFKNICNIYHLKQFLNKKTKNKNGEININNLSMENINE